MGLQIRSPRGDFTVAPQIAQAETIAAPYDVILLGLKAYALEAAIDDFAPAVGPKTMILPMLNGMRHIDLLVQRFGEERGARRASASWRARWMSKAISCSSTRMQQLIYGERSGELTTRVEALRSAARRRIHRTPLRAHHSRHVGEVGLSRLARGEHARCLGGSIGAIVAAGGEPAIARIFDECASVARASGNPPSERFLPTCAAPDRGRLAAYRVDVSRYASRQSAWRPIIFSAICSRARAPSVCKPRCSKPRTFI